MELSLHEQDHSEKLRETVAECALFLKRNTEFPLRKAEEILLYGNGVRHTEKGGTGSGEVNSHYVINVEDGFKDAGFNILTSSWLDAYEGKRIGFRKAYRKVIKKRARANHTSMFVEGMGVVCPEGNYDIPLFDGINLSYDSSNKIDIPCIYVLARTSGEGADREFVPGDVLLTETEIRDINALNAHCSKFMLVLNVGGVVDLSPVKGLDNILLLSQLGAETGAVLADIVLGNTYPSGKLSTTWAAYNEYCSVGTFGDRDNTYYNEGLFVGYRYFDSVDKAPLFPFGYGLGYTDFEMEAHPLYVEDDLLYISVRVKNVGNHPGKEVIQVYVSSPNERFVGPAKQLISFRKTKQLLPGEEETIEMKVRIARLSVYDEERARYVLEAGDYIVRVGNSSRNTKPIARITLENEIDTRICRRAFDREKACEGLNEDLGQPIVKSQEDLSEYPKFKITGESFYKEQFSYAKRSVIDPFIDTLSLSEIIRANLGHYKENPGVLGIIGDASTRVCGAAGETFVDAENRGFKCIVMADGPAGLRLNPDYYADENGVHSLGEAIQESFVEFMPAYAKIGARLLSKPKKYKGKIMHQYATAIPIGTAIAQSWNMQFAKMCGDIVGSEMQIYKVPLWLAPGMNIHRDIRCGRNFEYYSEDPILTGYIASAITKGVQSHEGCGVTIKHFAANNQERNRFNNNSVVSERTLREIYLRGFEICIKAAQPKAVMSSYNLINGEHTSCAKWLLNDILRIEWGFDGVIMSDWLVPGVVGDKNSIHPAPTAAKIVAAGGDLTMPGCKGDFESIKTAVERGYLSEEQLKINASRVYHLSEDLLG